MSTEEKETFQLANSSWICDKLFDVGDDKARDHCHITGKIEVHHTGVAILILN